MSKDLPIKVGLLKQSEIEEAGRIVRLAFGTFLGLPNPLDFMGDRNLMTPRWRSTHVKVIAARKDGRLLGTNVVTRWGSFGFFGPLTCCQNIGTTGWRNACWKLPWRSLRDGACGIPGCLRLRIA